MKKRYILILVLIVALVLGGCKKTVDPAQVKLDEAAENLGGVIGDPSNILTSFTLPTVLAGGVTAEWSSNNEDVAKVGTPTGGVVTIQIKRPAFGTSDVTLKLSAVLTVKAEKSDKNLTKPYEITITVKAETTEPVIIESIRDLLNLAKDEYDPADKKDKLSVSLENVTVVAKGSDAAFIYDGTGVTMVYSGASSDMKVGKVYNVEGLLEWYFGLWEIIDSTATEVVGATPQYPEKKVVTSVDDFIAELIENEEHFPAAGTAKDGNMEPILATITAKVYMVPGQDDNYNTYLIDTTKDTLVKGKANTDSSLPSIPASGLMAYYPTNDFALLRAHAGVEVTIDVVVHTYRSNNFAYAFYYVGGPEGIDVGDLDDEGKANVVKNALSITTEFEKNGTIVLPKTGIFGATITWDFKTAEDPNNALVNLTSGAVTIPAEGRVKVVITASVKVGDETVTRDFELAIGEYQLETVADALALDKGKTIMISGVVTDKFANNTYGLQDETGSIAIYTTEDLTLGRKYTLIGEKDNYNGLHQLKNIEIEKTETGTMPTPFAIDAIIADNAELAKHIAGRISINGAEVISVGELSGNNRIVKIKKGEVILEIRYDKRVFGGEDSAVLAALEVGDVVNYIGNLGWFNGPQLGFGPNTFVGEGEPELEDLPTVEGAITIAEFLALELGETGTIVGLITSVGPYNSFSMEDSTGATAFRISGKNSGNIDFGVGDVIVAKVKKAEFNGLIQAELVTGEAYEVKTGNFVKNEVIDLDKITELTAQYLLDNQSKMVKATNVEVTKAFTDSNTATEIKVTIGGLEVALRADKRVPGLVRDYLESLKVGDRIDINSATITVYNVGQLIIQKTEDVTGDGFDEIMFNADVNSFAFDKLTLTENTTLTLPKTYKGATVVWTVTEGATHINLETGLVTIPAETATLKLKAVFSKTGLTSVEKEYVFTLVPEGTVIGGVATLKYEGTTTTNMADGNNAATVGLNPSIFTVESDKGTGSNHIGLNSNKRLQLYQTGGGNTLTVELDEDFVITKIEIKFLKAKDNGADAKIMLGSVQASNTAAADITDKTVTFSDLNINDFSIQNVHSSNIQLWIDYIEITYAPAE